MAENKKGFMLYADLIHTVSKMPDEKAGQLLKTILEYVNDKNPKVDDLIIDLVFEPIKQQLKRDLVKWETRAKNSRKNGNKGGRPKKTEETEEVKEEPTETQQVISKPEKPVIVNDNVTVTDNVIVKDIKESKPFSFTLTKQYLLSNTSKEYQDRLREYINQSGKKMPYEDFYEKCEMKPYKYKNFQMAYNSWNKDSSKQKSGLGKSFDQMRKEEISNTVDVVLGLGVNPFDPSNYHQEEAIDVQIEG